MSSLLTRVIVRLSRAPCALRYTNVVCSDPVQRPARLQQSLFAFQVNSVNFHMRKKHTCFSVFPLFCLKCCPPVLPILLQVPGFPSDLWLTILRLAQVLLFPDPPTCDRAWRRFCGEWCPTDMVCGGLWCAESVSFGACPVVGELVTCRNVL